MESVIILCGVVAQEAIGDVFSNNFARTIVSIAKERKILLIQIRVLKKCDRYFNPSIPNVVFQSREYI